MRNNKPLDVMIEVKLSAEEAKAGAAPEDVPALVEAIRSCAAPASAGPDDHASLVRRRRTVAPLFPRSCARWPRPTDLKQLSMGMSHDLEVAIEEGATMVRIGTALFGPRKKTEAWILLAASARADRRGRLFRVFACAPFSHPGRGDAGRRRYQPLSSRATTNSIVKSTSGRSKSLALPCCTMRFCSTSSWELSQSRSMLRSSFTTTATWSEDLARELWRGRARSASDPQYFRYPMLKRVAERSLAVIVHNPAAGGYGESSTYPAR